MTVLTAYVVLSVITNTEGLTTSFWATKKDSYPQTELLIVVKKERKTVWRAVIDSQPFTVIRKDVVRPVRGDFQKHKLIPKVEGRAPHLTIMGDGMGTTSGEVGDVHIDIYEGGKETSRYSINGHGEPAYVQVGPEPVRMRIPNTMGTLMVPTVIEEPRPNSAVTYQSVRDGESLEFVSNHPAEVVVLPIQRKEYYRWKLRG